MEALIAVAYLSGTNTRGVRRAETYRCRSLGSVGYPTVMWSTTWTEKPLVVAAPKSSVWGPLPRLQP